MNILEHRFGLYIYFSFYLFLFVSFTAVELSEEEKQQKLIKENIRAEYYHAIAQEGIPFKIYKY